MENEKLKNSNVDPSINFNNNDVITKEGIIASTIIGLIITVISTILTINFIGAIFVGFVGLILAILFSIIWNMLYKSLKAKGSPITFGITNIVLGLVAGNSLWVIVYYTSRYIDINGNIVSQALYITLISVIAIITGGIVSLPYIKKTTSKQKIKTFGDKILPALTIMLFGYIIIYFISFVFALLGFDALWNIIVGLTYGVGPISILFSIIMGLIASFLFIETEILVSNAIGTAPKHQTYFYSMLLINAIVNLFIELFRLILKLVALSKD